MISTLSPLKLRGFSHLVLARTIDEFGDWLGIVALAVLVYDETRSALATTVLFLGMRFIPSVAAPVLVARLDGLRGTRVLPALYLLEAAVFAAIALVAPSFMLTVVLLLATIDGMLALTARALARAAAAAVLTPTGQLREGNALLNVGFTAAAALGPAAAGLVVAGLGVQAALLLDGASFVVVAVALFVAPLLAPERAERESWRTRLRAGLRYVRRRPALRHLLGAQAAAFVFFAAVIPIEVVYAKQTLGAGDAGYGALLASWGAGMVLGSLVFAALGRRSLRGVLLASTLMVAGAYLGLAGAGSLLAACVVSVVGGLGNGVQWVALMTSVQELTEDDLQARVVALLESIGAAMPGIGFLAGGVIASVASPRTTYLVAGLGLLLVSAAAARTLGRDLRNTAFADAQPPPAPPTRDGSRLNGHDAAGDRPARPPARA